MRKFELHEPEQSSSWMTLVTFASLLALPISGVFAGCSVAVTDQDTDSGLSGSDASNGGTDDGGTEGTTGWGSAGPTGDSWETEGSTEGPTGTSEDPTGTTDPSTTGDDTDSEGETTGEPEPDTGTDTDPEPVCDDATDVTLFLSPDDSNSMSSPVQVREQIHEYNDVYAAVRTWEFMNYFDFAYPAAEPGTLGLHVELVQAEAEGDQPEYILQIGVASETVSDADRAPINLTLSLDQSGSMAGLPIEMLRKSCEVMAGKLRAGDKVSVVTWDTENTIKLAGYEVDGPNDSVLLDVIDNISADGGTDLHSGLVKGYELASGSYDADRINRVVLISDGGANVGITDEDLIAQHAGSNDEDGIYMVGVGVENGTSYNDALMDTVTDVGKGASVFIPNAAEAEKIFGDQFVNTMAVAARDVQVQLDLPPGFEIVKFSGEEFGTDPTEIEPQHIAPNDAMVFHQRITTCAPDLVADGTAEVKVTVRWKDAKTFVEMSDSVTVTFDELLAAPSGQLLKGAAVFAYAEAAKAAKTGFDFQEKVAEAQAAVADAQVVSPDDPELAHIAEMLGLLLQ